MDAHGGESLTHKANARLHAADDGNSNTVQTVKANDLTEKSKSLIFKN